VQAARTLAAQHQPGVLGEGAPCLDAVVDTRIHVDKNTTIQAGAEGGVLFPGHAFDDAEGTSLDNQYAGAIKLGMQF